MNADEIMRALRHCATRSACNPCPYLKIDSCCAQLRRDAADLIESLHGSLIEMQSELDRANGRIQGLREGAEMLKADLAASQRRERAAEAELAAHAHAHAPSCKRYDACYAAAYKRTAMLPCAVCDEYEFSGPQEAGEGEQDE